MSSLQTHSAGTYLRLLGFVRPHWRQFALSIVAMLALAGTEWMMPALLKPLIDEDFSSAAVNFMGTPILLIGLFILRGALSYVGTVALAWVAQRTVADLRAAMFARLIRLPAAFFDARGTGELISKFTFDVTQVSQAATNVVTVMIKDSAVILVLFSYLFYLNWRLALLLFLFAPPIAVIVRRTSRRMRDMSRRLQDSMADINAAAEEAVRGNREIKIFDGYAAEIARFDRAINNTRKYHMKVVRTSAAIVPMIQLCVAAGIALMIFIALKESAAGAITRGDFVAFVTATALLLAPTKRLAGANEFLQRGLAAAEAIFALTDAPLEADEGFLETPIRGHIRFEEVTVEYGERQALTAIDLEIAPGETVALVGRSGGGKTTLVNLVPRFYQPRTGRILLDGIPLERYRLDALRRNIAYVGQNIVLFNDTLYNNIAFGALRDAPEAAVLAAAERAQVAAFAQSLPEGLQTLIGDNGVRLSGGQRQRVALARALLKQAPILILDEATAALDNEAERQVQDALDAARAGRTSLIVAHRLSTIEQADRIIVLDAGRIVEAGKHAELLTRGGVYAKLYAAGFDESPASGGAV